MNKPDAMNKTDATNTTDAMNKTDVPSIVHAADRTNVVPSHFFLPERQRASHALYLGSKSVAGESCEGARDVCETRADALCQRLSV